MHLRRSLSIRFAVALNVLTGACGTAGRREEHRQIERSTHSNGARRPVPSDRLALIIAHADATDCYHAERAVILARLAHDAETLADEARVEAARRGAAVDAPRAAGSLPPRGFTPPRRSEAEAPAAARESLAAYDRAMQAAIELHWRRAERCTAAPDADDALWARALLIDRWGFDGRAAAFSLIDRRPSSPLVARAYLLIAQRSSRVGAEEDARWHFVRAAELGRGDVAAAAYSSLAQIAWDRDDRQWALRYLWNARRAAESDAAYRHVRGAFATVLPYAVFRAEDVVASVGRFVHDRDAEFAETIELVAAGLAQRGHVSFAIDVLVLGAGEAGDRACALFDRAASLAHPSQERAAVTAAAARARCPVDARGTRVRTDSAQ